MKKFLCIFMVLALLLCAAGCGTAVPDHADTPDVEQPDKKPSDKEEETIEELQFDENIPLFAAQNRYDVEGDQYEIYYYNHKGELLYSEPGDMIYSSMGGRIGMYGNCGLAPAYDSATELYGFVDRDGIFVIEPQWAWAKAFSDDGIAIVGVENEERDYSSWYKYGFVNDKGEQVIPCIYHAATSFYQNGLAIVGKEVGTGEDISLKYGVIDTKGNVIVPLEHDEIDHIAGDYILCRIGTYSYKQQDMIYDLAGNLVHSQDRESADGMQTYLYTVSGKTLCRITMERDETNEYTVILEEVFDGKEFKAVEMDDIRIETRRVATTSSGTAYGVVRGEETVIPFAYDGIKKYGDYYIAYKGDNYYHVEGADIYNKNFEKTAENVPYAFEINRNRAYGKGILLPAGYFWAWNFVDVENDDDRIYGIVDYTGQEIVPVIFEYTNLFTYEGMGGSFGSKTWMYDRYPLVDFS